MSEEAEKYSIDIPRFGNIFMEKGVLRAKGAPGIMGIKQAANLLYPELEPGAEIFIAAVDEFANNTNAVLTQGGILYPHVKIPVLFNQIQGIFDKHEEVKLKGVIKLPEKEVGHLLGLRHRSNIPCLLIAPQLLQKLAVNFLPPTQANLLIAADFAESSLNLKLINQELCVVLGDLFKSIFEEKLRGNMREKGASPLKAKIKSKLHKKSLPTIAQQTIASIILDAR